MKALFNSVKLSFKVSCVLTTPATIIHVVAYCIYNIIKNNIPILSTPPEHPNLFIMAYVGMYVMNPYIKYKKTAIGLVVATTSMLLVMMPIYIFRNYSNVTITRIGVVDTYIVSFVCVYVVVLVNSIVGYKNNAAS